MKTLSHNRNKKTMVDGSVYNFSNSYNNRTLSNYEIKKGIDGVCYNCNSNNGFCYKTTLLTF